MENKVVNLFVPGRLCLFGEHTDWASLYRTVNSSIVKGAAIVCGTEQGIYALAEKDVKFRMCSSNDMTNELQWECEMDTLKLNEVAQKGGYFSYVAGVASYINDNYIVGGVKITILKRDLPLKSGLSSSAAICVLVARAFNQLYNLKMNIKGEMLAAFRGEQRTPSRCGRLDQACAYGVKPVMLEFDGAEIDTKEIRVGGNFFFVIANLMASKNTIKILSDLNKSYPFANSERDMLVQEALGIDNQKIVNNAKTLIESGDPEGLGALMTMAQENFDKKISPASEELIAPVLHSVLSDPKIKELTYGAKGVGSNGDGSVQFLAKSEEDAVALQTYLKEVRGMPSFTLTIKPCHSVKKAIIPLAGFGTRVFPATKCLRKCFMPILDVDGLLKPALMIMLEQLFDSGIEEVALIIGEDEKDDFERFFRPLSLSHYESLPDEKKKCEEKIIQMSKRITYIYQHERKGFGHAVWLAKDFSDGNPVLLLLGDFVYVSNNDLTCSKQIIDAFKSCGKTLVSINEIPLNQVVHYGVLHGSFEDNDTLMKVDAIVEKPTDDYAKEYLGVKKSNSVNKYYATFGQYVLTYEVFEELEKIICSGVATEGSEFGLTSALSIVQKKYGIYGYVPNGKSFDIGLPEAYRNTIINFVN